jgi:hypothetical protein
MTRVFAAALCCLGFASFAHADVVLLKTPHRRIQPQAVVDAHGNLHLLYFVGTPANGNLMYVRRDMGKKDFTTPIQVNSQEGSAVATGTIRGGHLALGKNGRVHVAWNGSMKAEPKNPIQGMPMMYARLADDGKRFEPQRNLMTQSAILDGGGSLTADAKGNVYVAWHGLGKELVKGENNRKVWVSVSKDDGKTFAAEQPAWNENTGACGCCGMRGFTDLKGNAYFLYRAASEKINRGMYILSSMDLGKTFSGRQLDNWKIYSCPMSSEAFAEGPNGIVAAWDNDGRIQHVLIQPNVKLANLVPVQVRSIGGANQKHPSLAFNKNGEMLLAWTEGTGWNRGGALVWQKFDKTGNATESGRRDGAIPVWGLPSVIAEPDGRFVILH